MSDSLNVIYTISPWWWITLAFVLGTLEMATLSFFLIWPALAALLMGGITVIFPSLSTETQLVIFAVLAFILTVIGRYILKKYANNGLNNNSVLNQRAKRFVGSVGIVLEADNGQGILEIKGMRWQIKWSDQEKITTGQSVRVIKTNGMVLDVETIK